jgi:geranylgeranyl pyrophosphate synthase/predicted secreted hydrolase
MRIDIESGVREHREDWPAPGSIDLDLHDLPHASAGIEWWYVNAHLAAADGRRFGVFAAFFRLNTATAGAEPSYQHFLIWALTDPEGQRYFPCTRLDRRTPETVLAEFDAGRGPGDERIHRAVREVFAQGRVPLPDRLLTRDARVASDRLELDFDGDCFAKHGDGSYELDLSSEPGGCSCRLHFVLEKPVIRHGDDGVVRGVGGERMFYYFSPRCRVDGFLTIDGTPLHVDGSGWYDHEFGEARESNDGLLPTVGWNWLSAHLENGWDVTAYDLFDKADASRSHGRWVILVDPVGERHAYRDFTFEALDSWTSTRTFNEYPTRYRLEVDEAALSLDIVASQPEQELITVMSPPAFWEGLVMLTGVMSGRPIAGQGFIERSGVSTVDTTDDFFASVGRETRRAIETLLPAQPDADQALAMIGGPRRQHFLESVDLEQYARTLVEPIREIILRGGKSWRSYSILCCMDLVGGNSQPFANWLALPELLHVGSLIIDDVQDRSEVRRGGLSCHRLYGEALAINAGCASYFLAQIPVGASRLSDSMRARIYEAYFEALRAGHAGQAFDIAGLADLMPAVVESGDGDRLERRVIAVHRLKSAAPAGALARMSAFIGGGTDEQAEGLGQLFESYGVAFQIVDDVLNLRGFDENRKSRGEDITQGKITAPVAKAMGLLSRRERERLWAILAAKPDAPGLIGEAVDLIDSCGALDACEADARALVESTWQSVSSLVPDSQFKIRLRAFGWFILDRHY